MPDPEPQRALCPYCGKRVRVCKDGHLRHHSPAHSAGTVRCPGVDLTVTPAGTLAQRQRPRSGNLKPQVTCSRCGRRVTVLDSGRPRHHAVDGRRGGQQCTGSRLYLTPAGTLTERPRGGRPATPPVRDTT